MVCADGGLMHLALAASAPVTALFDAGIDPAWRLPPGFEGRVLRAAERNVSAIDPQQVAEAALSMHAAAAAVSAVR